MRPLILRKRYIWSQLAGLGSLWGPLGILGWIIMSSPFHNILKELYRLQQGGDIIISMVWPSCPQHAICYQNGGCEICWRCISSLFNCYCISINELFQHIGTLIDFYPSSFIIRLYLPKVFWSQTEQFHSWFPACMCVCTCVLVLYSHRGHEQRKIQVLRRHSRESPRPQKNAFI